MTWDSMAIFSLRYRLITTFAFLAAGASIGTTVEAVSAAPSVAAHRAIYDLGLAEASDRSGITSVTGRLVLEINGSKCEGFAINSRIVTRFTTNQGKTNQTDIRSSSWESGDGKSFRFGTRQYLNQTLGDKTAGRASRGEAGKPGAGILTEPKEEAFELPSETVFPSEHNQRIMETAFAGKSIDNSLVYDGTEGKKLYNATTIVGREKAPGKSDLTKAGESAKSLGKLRSWPVTVSFFEKSEEKSIGEQTPSHEVSFDLYENGVSAKLLLNYGDFSISGVLSGLEMFSAPVCP